MFGVTLIQKKAFLELDLDEYVPTPLVGKDESGKVCVMLWVLFIGSGFEATA